MSNVVDFPGHRAGQDSEASAARARRADALRRRLSAEPMLAPRTRERLAENLHRLLARLEADGRLRRVELCRRVFGTSQEESTKRLRNFALDPAKEGETREKALSALQKKAARYFELAEAAADMAGEDRDAVILDLVHGTPLANEGRVAAEDPLDADLKGSALRALERGAETVSGRTGLQRAFKLLAKFPMRIADPFVFDEENVETIVAGSVNAELPYLEDGSAGPPPSAKGSDWWRLAYNAPVVLLGEAVLASLDQEPRFAYRPWRTKQAAHTSPDGAVWSATTEYRLQVWLGIFPFGTQHEPRMGLRLGIVRRVRISRTTPDVEFSEPAPLPPLSPEASPEQKRSHDLIERLRKAGPWREGPRRPEVVHEERVGGIQRMVSCRSGDPDADVAVPVDLAPLDPWLPLLLGRPLDERDSAPSRVLALSSEHAHAVLDLLDCRSISDWVGPRPDRLYSSRRIGREPDLDDPEYEARMYEADQAGEEDRAYRFRFEGDAYGGPHTEERFPLAWAPGTLGYKLERSLLEVTGPDSVLNQLAEGAGQLAAKVDHEVGAALRAREDRLAGLHRSLEE